jgi:23S rRNA (adenine2503-C2)-methyltransferase
MAERRLIYDLNKAELGRTLEAWGQPAYRAQQVWHALYRELIQSPSEVTTLPLDLRSRLEDSFVFLSLTPGQQLKSSDGETEKKLLTTPDGQAFEAVLMRYFRRRTACISTQAGCAMGCVFCATGQMGLKRQLSSGEIIEQVLLFARQLATEGDRLTNVVVMGMGEPFHNYDATLGALDRLNDDDGFNFGARRFTISTVGLVPKIKQFTDEGRPYNLAISLHAASDDLRSQLLPIAKKYPLALLLDAAREYVGRSGRRVTFEWALIQDVNDGIEQAERLAEYVQGLLCHVNLIPLNPTHGFTGGPTTRTRARAFQSVLNAHDIPCTIRVRRGIDIQAGCGQLATKAETAH